jgi:hypothetical protein
VLDGMDSQRLARQREDQPVVADVQAEPADEIALQFLYVALSGADEAE